MAITFSILSSGQTEADRAALDFAIKNQIPHGGWCPKGQLTVDGTPDAQYLLKETPTESYLESLEWNIRDTDASIVLTLAPKATGGAQKTNSISKKLKKPCLHLHKGILGVPEKLIAFTEKYYVRRLNIAGPAEADEPGIAAWVTSILERTKTELERREAGARF